MGEWGVLVMEADVKANRPPRGWLMASMVTLLTSGACQKDAPTGPSMAPGFWGGGAGHRANQQARVAMPGP